jgi:homocitrate synthase NifV
MNAPAKAVVLRDSTLREGLDTPKVCFSLEQKFRIAGLLQQCGVPEVEIIAPSRVVDDLEFARLLREAGTTLRITGLIYANSDRCERDMAKASPFLDRFDLLMPLAANRAPSDFAAKIWRLGVALRQAAQSRCECGAGFPHATTAEVDLLLEIATTAVAEGARRITIYDTNGSADPFGVRELITSFKSRLDVPIFFHAHNDLGMATANATAAVLAGASGVDVTVNGLGDRAGNAALEQVAVVLRLRNYVTGIDLSQLGTVSTAVESESGVKRSKLAPIVGEYVFWHKSPSHLACPELFEAVDPNLLSSERKMVPS